MAITSNLVEAIPGLIWTAFVDGRADFVNKQWSNYTGIGVDDACDRGWHRAFHPDEYLEFLARCGGLKASIEAVEWEGRLQRFDGVYHWFLFRMCQLDNVAEPTPKWCGIAFDIDERRLAEETVRERDRSFHLAVDGLPALICLTDNAGNPEFGNRALIEYFGRPFEELKKLPAADTLHPEDREEALALWWTSVDTGHPYDFVGRQRRADGVYRWLQIRGFPLRGTDGLVHHWCLLQTDIEDRKQAEGLLRGEKRLLEMIAHGQPLGTVLEATCNLVEATAIGCLASILTVDAGESCFRLGAGPSLPKDYNDVLDGKTIEPSYGPCSLAVALRAPVITVDLALDARWAGSAWPPLMATYDLRSCWSMPVLSRSGETIGVFAIYRHDPAKPTASEQELIGRFTHIVGIAIEHALGAASLRDSEARKAAILNSALDCIVTIDHKGHVTEFNPAAEQTFGYRRGDVLGKELAEVIIPPSMREKHRRGFTHHLTTGEASLIGRRIELTAMHSDGREFPVELAISRNPSDGSPSFTGYLRDITERKQSDSRLRRTNAYLAEAQHISCTGSFSWCVDTNEIEWSAQVYRIHGYPVDIPVDVQMIADRFLPDDLHLLANMLETARRVSSMEFEYRLMMPDKSIRHIHLMAHAHRNHLNELEFIGAVQDVTERRRSEEVLGEVRSQLALVTKMTSLGALTASIAHEVNQPLSGIITNATTCLRMLGADPPNVLGAIETARRTIRDGNRAADVIAQLRALFGNKDVAMGDVDLNDATLEVIALSSNEILYGRANLRLELMEGLKPALGDRVQLQQVILNLLLNALDAMAGIEDRSRRILIRTHLDGPDRIRLAVEDTGAGFDPLIAEKLFQAFHTTKSNGMGIGLSVSRTIIESHNGYLWGTLNEGPGSTFAFSIPTGKTDDENSAPQTRCNGQASLPAAYTIGAA
jgi:PAS domain S-box-containing protein